MDDRELIERAAKAAGIVGVVGGDPPCVRVPAGVQSGYFWKPLENDGDAFRLMVKLGLYIQGKFTRHQSVREFIELGEPAAVRRAIVRAAAAMGSGKG